MSGQPVMPACRRALVQRAFAKLDANFDGVITVDDLKGVYNGRKHPKYLNGMWTEAEVFQEWLNYFNGPDNLCGEVRTGTMHGFQQSASRCSY